MTRKERYQAITEYFLLNNPNAETELFYTNPYELLVAVILSAQCTDKRVNLTTPAMFKDFPTPEDLARTDFDTLFPYIRSISYPNNKTKHLIGMAKMLVEVYGSKVPSSIEELIKLPGVGRKTANVIVSVVFDKPAMAVDTHVFRVSKRLGLINANTTTPLAAEKTLVSYLPEKFIAKAHHWLILHGRYTCTARNPQCEKCGISHLCKHFESLQKKKETARN